MALFAIELTKTSMNGLFLNPKCKKVNLLYQPRSVASEDSVYQGSREASLCFEYLKTYLLPPLGGENPVGLIKKIKNGTKE